LRGKEYRAERIRQRMERLKAEVYAAIHYLHNNGKYPSVRRVSRQLVEFHPMNMINEEICDYHREVCKELGYNFEDEEK
jgi:hypothetical protein